MTDVKNRVRARPGDMFAIPLRGRGFGFGRILYQQGRWKLAEFFSCFDSEPAFSEEILHADRAMPVHNIVTLPIESGDWPIIKRDVPVPPDLANLRFYRGLKGARGYVGIDGSSGPLAEVEVESMASSMPQFPEYISDLLWERLQQRRIVG